MPNENPSFDYEAALAACAAGDRQALERIYQQEGPRMLGVALRIVHHRALAEDIVHDACIAIWTRASSYQSTLGSGRGWIYTVVRHLALNAVRNGSRHVDIDDITSDALQASHSLQAWNEQLEQQDQMASLGRLEHCLQALEPQRRHCLLHAYVDGCTHAEIAARLDTPLGTIKAWIRRSLSALQECMA